jgi:2-iminoacetate synthase ThiH
MACPPPKNEFFYFENGLMVFTEKYHLNRGYCCKNGCRHCPYGFNSKQKIKTEPDKTDTGKPDDKA